ncbi:MAG: hypothetical protein ACYDAY_09020 [Candidatus Dormibacteria bacterium]
MLPLKEPPGGTYRDRWVLVPMTLADYMRFRQWTGALTSPAGMVASGSLWTVLPRINATMAEIVRAVWASGRPLSLAEISAATGRPLPVLHSALANWGKVCRHAGLGNPFVGPPAMGPAGWPVKTYTVPVELQSAIARARPDLCPHPKQRDAAVRRAQHPDFEIDEDLDA